MKIILADHAGYCYGVERALKIAEKAANSSREPLSSLGPLIHNEPVVQKLNAEKGIKPIHSVDEIENGKVIIRAHGVSPEVIERAEKAGNRIINATCPFVTRAQIFTEQLREGGYKIFILGDKDHPEVIGLKGHAGDKAVVIKNAGELPAGRKWKKAGLVVQTTQDISRLQEVVKELVTRCSELKVYNTICRATSDRQDAARDLASRCDLMLVVGDRQSGNTRRLTEICLDRQPDTHRITTADEIDERWLEGIETVGVTAGASTPDFSIKEVVERLNEYSEQQKDND